jgi:malate/lactate dehydrogenase
MIVYGNHSASMFPNYEQAYIEFSSNNGQSVEKKPVTDLITDLDFLQNEFCSKVAKRGSEVLKVKGSGSNFSAAKAICDHFRCWFAGSAGEPVSMGVFADGSAYGIAKGLFFSVPVICRGGFEYSVDNSVQFSEFAKGKFAATHEQLIAQRKTAIELMFKNAKNEDPKL